MRKIKEYNFNASTLSFEESRDSGGGKWAKNTLLFAGSVLLSLCYFAIYFFVVGPHTPKQYVLESTNARLRSDLEVANSRLDGCEKRLADIEERDNLVYRSIFGMEEIPADVREAGYGGVDRYSHLFVDGKQGLLARTVMRMDRLNRKAYIQSVSFDDVRKLSRKAGDMASCIPAISPLTTDPEVARYSSSFGYRPDPGTGQVRMHSGIDLSADKGTPIYATGNGVVSKVGFDFYGYGHYIIVDHGFGYKTRYGHMSAMSVSQGQKVQRGQMIGEVGNTGRSFGNHVHYEVIYKGRCVNPINYLDLEMNPDEYAAIISSVGNKSV